MLKYIVAIAILTNGCVREEDRRRKESERMALAKEVKSHEYTEFEIDVGLTEICYDGVAYLKLWGESIILKVNRDGRPYQCGDTKGE